MDKVYNIPESVQPPVEAPDHSFETILSSKNAGVKAARIRKDTKVRAPDDVCHLVKEE